MTIDLPLIFSIVIAFSIFMYVLMDGFSLGVGILFRWAPSDEDRDTMMNSTAPIWDGNQTWLVLGGGGLLAAFPIAYSIILPALYIPIIVMFTDAEFSNGPPPEVDSGAVPNFTIPGGQPGTDALARWTPASADTFSAARNVSRGDVTFQSYYVHRKYQCLWSGGRSRALRKRACG